MVRCQARFTLLRLNIPPSAPGNIEREITMREMDLIVLTRDVPDRGLRAGDIGTVVLVHRGGAGYEVEFSTLAGQTLGVVTLRAGDVRPVGDREIAHARQVA